MNFNKKEILDFIKDLVIIILVVVFIRTFIAEPFQISWWSMNPSYYDKEFIIVDRFSYLDIPGIKKWVIHRWDVIVFKPGVSKEREYYIKRVIWLPWDTIKIENWKVYLKKKWSKKFVELDEPYLNKENKNHTYTRDWDNIFEVPENSYFVMWDNRNHSDDSRSCFYYSCSVSPVWNFITKKEIVWKVFLDLGYFNFKKFAFIQDENWVDTHPKFFSSPSSYDYKND